MEQKMDWQLRASSVVMKAFSFACLCYDHNLWLWEMYTYIMGKKYEHAMQLEIKYLHLCIKSIKNFNFY